MTPLAENERVPRGAMFFVSYSRVGDLPRAETLVNRLIGLGAAEAEVWFELDPVSWTPRSTKSVIHGRPVRSLATNRNGRRWVTRCPPLRRCLGHWI